MLRPLMAQRGWGRRGQGRALGSVAIHRKGPTGPAVSVSAAIRPRGIPGDDLVGGVCRLPLASRVRVDQRQAAERASDIELIRILGRDQKRTLAGATRDGRLQHTVTPGPLRGRLAWLGPRFPSGASSARAWFDPSPTVPLRGRDSTGWIPVRGADAPFRPPREPEPWRCASFAGGSLGLGGSSWAGRPVRSCHPASTP